MAGTNPISYKDFFDFTDDSLLRKAIDDINTLKKAYEDFTGSVVGNRMQTLITQQTDLATSIRELVKQTEGLNITNKQSQQSILEQSAALEALQKQYSENKRAKQETKAAEEVLAGSVEGLTARLRNQLAEYNKLDPAVEGHLDRMLKLAQAAQQTRTAIQQLTTETKQATATYTAAAGSYQELDRQTRQLVADLKALGGGMSANNAEAAKLQAQIFANTAQLKQFDAAMNQNFRNVGNYKSAFNGLNVATSQLFRELPALAINANTFFLAISNNLPMLFDEIAKVKKANEEAVVAGKAAVAAAAAQAEAEAVLAGATREQTVATVALATAQAEANAASLAAPGLLKALLRSVLSFNTLMTLAVLGLTLFGGKIIDFFTGSSEESKAAEEANKKYAESLRSIEVAARTTGLQEVTSLRNVAAAAANVNLRYEDRVFAMETLQSRFPAYFANLSKEAILNGNVESAIKGATAAILAQAAATANKGKFEAASKTVADIQQSVEDTTAAINAAIASSDAETKRYFKAVQQQRAGQKVTDPLGSAGEIFNRLTVSSGTIAKVGEMFKKLDGFNKQLNSATADQLKFLANTEKSAEVVATFADKALGNGRTTARIGKELESVEKVLKVTTIGTARYNELLAQQTKLQAELDAANGKKTEAEKASDAALKARLREEKQFQALLTKRIELINKTADADISQAEFDFSQSDRSSYRQIELETLKRDTAVKAANDVMAIVAEGTKEYETAAKKKLDAERAFVNEVRQINQRRFEEEDAIMKELQERRNKEYEARLGAERAGTNLVGAAGLGANRLAVVNGTMSQKDADKKLYDLGVQTMLSEIAMRRRVMNEAIEGSQDYYNKREALLNKERELIEFNADYEVRKAEEVKQKKQAIAEAALDFASTLASSATDLFTAQYDAQLDELEHNKNYELSLVGDNAAAKKKLEEKAAKDSANIRRNQAEAAKFEALFQIAIQTAQAVMKSVALSPTTFGLPFSAFAAATGIAQATLVAARPLPKYFVGRGKGRSEFAHVNDQGWELIENRGRFRVAAGGQHAVTYLSAEDKVHTHAESKKLLAQEYGVRSAASAFSDSLSTGTAIYSQQQDERENRIVHALTAGGLNKDTLTAAFVQSLQTLPIESHSLDESGYRRFVVTANTRVESLNQRQKLGGNG